MKIFTSSTKFALFVTFVALFASCAGTQGKDGEKVGEAGPKSNSTTMLNIRYIDKDSLLRNYNLAKDLNEAMLRTSDKYEAAQRQKAGEIQKFAAVVQNKYQTNGYLSEASFNADQQKLQRMQVDAENYLGNLQRSIQNEMMQNNIQLNDSVENFIKIYNKEKGYDAILDKAATFFIDSKYDITDDIIKGLNARYNKVEAKK
ncbi:MAG: OmpH family outer membrane protein [Muribaculaceae bacterium]|nr:OmpH family outer membrane protein [Muribaculaceae bacterium]